MSLYNKFIRILFLLSCFLFSEVGFTQGDAAASVSKSPTSFSTWSVSYVSWTEFLEMNDGTIHDEGYSNFYGNAFSYEQEFYSGRSGFMYDVALLSGQANAGGSQQLLTYQSANQKWFGGQVGVKLAYRVTPQVAIALGPIGLYRSLKFPSDGGVDVKSGADFNFGMIADLKLRLTRNWELRQSIGTLSFRASTLWSLGLGYKY